MNGARWRGWVAGGVIFVFGVAIGAGMVAWTGQRVIRQALQNSPGEIALADRAATRIGTELQGSLRLSAEEAARVRAILDQSARNLKALRVSVGGQAAAELRGAVGRIAAELPPGKRVELYRLLGRRYERLGLTPPRANAAP